MEDKLVVAVNLVAGLWAGYTYYDIGMYMPLMTLWGSPGYHSGGGIPVMGLESRIISNGFYKTLVICNQL